MARLGPVKLGLALALVFTATLDGATSDDKCRTGCKGITPRDFKFVEGTTYKYNYEGNIDISLSSAEGQQSTTKVRATVLLSQQSQCDQVLRLQNFQIIGADSKKYTNLEGIDKPIRINFHDGHIEDVICTEASDTQNSLNVKRAIASMFQAFPKHSTETDVFGLCPTDFSTHKEGGAFVIKKARNLNKCLYRENIKQDFMATAFDTNSEIKSSPFLQGDFKSELRIKGGILEHVTVTESYLYVPFSVGNSGAKAVVQSKLSLAGTSKDNPKTTCSKPRSVIFENPHPIHSDKTNVNSILGALKETASTITETVKENTANKFSNLIRVIRVAKKNDLLTVYNQVRAGAGFTDKIAAKNTFLDALFRAGSGDSVDAAMELYKNKELGEIESKLFFLGMAFVKHVGSDTLKTAASLLDVQNLPREAYLGIGTLAGRFCREHPCDNVDQVNVLMKAFVAKLNVKITNGDVENTVIATLKAVKNSQYVTDNLAAKVTQLAQDKPAPIRVRIAALEAYMSDPCLDKFRDSAINIMKDIQLDSEIRIKAYLAATECANGKVAKAVKTLMENEPSYQVGGFIVSHLRTLRTSVNPDKAHAKAQLGEIIVTKKYPFDLRKYSFNAELSHSFETFGLMSSTESNVIYSQKSFTPRSVSLNLTAQVFGHTFNFLEIDARQENWDKLAEHYFGPMGPLRKLTSAGLYNKAQEKAKETDKTIKSHVAALRGKRDVSKSHIDYITNQLTDKQNELNKDLDLDLSVKLFGSEILFLSLNDDVFHYTPDAIIDKIFSAIDKHMTKLSDLDEIIRSNVVFLNSEISYPTSLGFPLRLSIDGTSSVQIKVVNSMTKDKVKLSLVPSANIELASRFVLDAALIEGGLKVVGNLYSATGGSLDLLADKSGHMEYKFELPLEKQHLVTATHDLVFETRELGGSENSHPIKMTQNKDFSVCLDHLSPIIGLTFCAEINQPNVAAHKGIVLPYPLNGNSKFSVYIEKTDLGHYYYSETSYTKDGKRGYESSLGAVDKQGNPKVSLDLKAFVRPDIFVLVTLTSPIKSATLEARVIDIDKEKSLFAKIALDKIEYYAKLGVAVSGTPTKATYKPLMELKAGTDAIQKPPYYVDGQIIVEVQGPTTKYTFDNVKLIGAAKPITLTGNVALDKASGLTADIGISDGSQKGSFKGLVKLENDLFKLNSELQNSINPQLNFNLKCELKKGAHDLESSFQLIHGADLSSKKNIFKMTNSIKAEVESDKYDVGTKNHMSYPALELATTLNFEATRKSLDYDVDFAYKKIKFGSELEAKINMKVVGDYDVEFDLHGFENKLAFEVKREIAGTKSKVNNKISLNDKIINLDGTVTHVLDTNKVDVGTNLILKVSGRPDTTVVSKLSYNPVDVDALIKITSSGTAIIDAFLKANKAGNANGSVKLNVKDVITANGQIKAVKGAGNANILVEIVKLQRKVKSEATFTVKDPTYNVDVTLLTDFGKDDNKKYRLATTNQIKPDFLDSKNIIEFVGKTITANVKGGYAGSIWDGKQHFDFDVTLPNEHYFAGKFNRELHDVKKVINGNAMLTLEHRGSKNEQGRKLTYKGEVKDTNFEEHKYDSTFALSLDNNGASANVDVALKGWKKDKKIVADWKMKVFGTILKESVEGEIYSELEGKSQDYKVHVKQGAATSLDIKGKYNTPNTNDRKPYTSDITVELKTPIADLSSVKFHNDEYLLSTGEKRDIFEMKGSTSLFVENSEKKETTINFKTTYDMAFAKDKGHAKGTLEMQKLDPVNLSIFYDVQKLGEGGKCHCGGSLQYKSDKTVKGDFSYEYPGHGVHNVDIQVETPDEHAKNVRLQVNSKKSNDDKARSAETIFTINGDKYTISSDVDLSEHHPSYSFVVKRPDGKIDKFVSKVTRIGDKSFAGEAILWYTPSHFVFEGSIDINAEDMDDFLLKLNANCPTLKVDKFELTANTKDAKGTKKIIFSAKSANKNLLTGSTTYKTREEGGKFVLEGSGSFKYKDESKSGNFKFSRQILTTEKNHEHGVEITFDAALGNKAIDAEFKATNKHFRILNSFCEEKQQCAHIEVDSKTSANEVDHFSNVWEVTMDLRKLGLSHEFGMKGVTNRKELKLDHTLEVHFQSHEHKYEYSAYIHPNKAGLSLTTPKRVVAIEADFTTTHSDTGVTVGGDVSIYLNKKAEPNKKTSVSMTMTTDNKPKEHYKLTSEFKLTHPALKKPLTSSYKYLIDVKNLRMESDVTIDIFQTSKDVIAMSAVFDGKEHTSLSTLSIDIQPLKYKFVAQETFDIDLLKTHKYSYDLTLVTTRDGKATNCHVKTLVTPQESVLLVKLMNNVLLNVDAKTVLTKETQTIDAEVTAVGVEPRKAHIEIKNFNTLKFYLSRAANPDDKLVVNSALIPSQIADFRMEVSKGGKTIDLMHGYVKLDNADFMKSDYGMNKDNLKTYLYEPSKKNALDFINESKNVLTKVVTERKDELKALGESAKNANPGLKPVVKYYESELEKLKQEITADKTIMQISESLGKIVSAIITTIKDMAHTFDSTFEEIWKTVKAQYVKIAETVEKDLWPKIHALIDKLTAQFAGVFEQVSEAFFFAVAQITAFVDAHQDLFKQLAQVFAGVGQDVGRFVMKTYEQSKTILTTELNKLYEELKALPLYEQIKAAYEQLLQGMPVSEDVIQSFKHTVETLKDMIAIDEIKSFIDVTTNYLVKKMKQETVDDWTEIEAIFRALTTAIKKLIAQIDSHELETAAQKVPLTTRLVATLPKLVLSQTSIFNAMSREDLPDLSTMFYSVDFNPASWVAPFRYYGIIVQGQHIFTFDGKHLTFPGKCNYLLAKDAVNGNFTVAGTYTNGILTAISVSDKTNIVTIKKGGVAMLNNAAVELPIRTPLTDAFRTYDTVTIFSKTGVKVTCSVDLMVCVVRVSGFYHAQLKGLLGNANNEPYDDYVLPNGKIVTSESEFGNAYKMQNNCPVVKTVDHHSHHHVESCNKLFSEDSDLIVCYPFVNPANFRQACDHGVAAGIPGTEEAIAKGYISACNTKKIPTDIPAEYVKCENGEQTRKLGEKFSVKTPQKAADIVVAVDVVKSNEPIYKEMVVNMVQSLVQELGARGVKDVEVHVITYGGDNKEYPSHVTTNGGKMTSKGKMPTLKFSEVPEDELDIDTGNSIFDLGLSMLDNWTHDINLAIGNTPQAKAYKEGIQYPYRSNALKAMIAVTGAPCEKGRLFWLQIIRAVFLHDESVSLHTITPLDDKHFKVKDEKTTKNVIGFNKHGVFTFTDAKKKPQGNPDLLKELSIDEYCVDFTYENGGNVFVSNNFLNAKGNKRLYSQVVAYNIAESLTTVEMGLDCQCERSKHFGGVNRCNKVYEKSKPPTGRKIMRG